MPKHVDHVTVGVTDEEAPHPPRLVCKRVHDLGTGLEGSRVGGVDVVDLNRDVRHNGSGLVGGSSG